MQNLKRKIRKIKVKLLICQQFLGNFRQNNRLEPKNRSISWFNKRHLRADVLSLLSSALRPRLLVIQRSEERDKVELNRGGLSLNVVKIVVMTTIFSSFGLFTLNFATPVSATSLTLSVPSDPLFLELQPNSTFTKSSSSSVSVKTDAFAGYSLSIKAKNNNELVNRESKLTSISQNLSEEQYQGEGNINTWGYKPSKFNSLDNNLFLPGPTTEPSILESTKAANSDAANTYEFALGAKADATINQGAYQNTFVFYATANTVSYKITYELNSGSWSGTSPQTGSTAESTIALDSNKPSRSGYEFLGWCNQSTTTSSCSGTKYQPGAGIPLINGENDITLYAIWQQNGTSYNIQYNTNGGSSQNPTTGTTTGTTVSLNYSSTRDGYFLVGWCSNYTNSESCSGTTYSILGNSYYPLSNGTNVTLYAIWHRRGSGTCNSTGIRMKDGKCWSASNITHRATWSQASSYCTGVWHLPSSSEYIALYRSYYPAAKSDGSQYNGSTSAFYYDFVGGGHYWTSTSYSSDAAYNFYLQTTSVSSGYLYCLPRAESYTKQDNFSVRCVSN